MSYNYSAFIIKGQTFLNNLKTMLIINSQNDGKKLFCSQISGT